MVVLGELGSRRIGISDIVRKNSLPPGPNFCAIRRQKNENKKSSDLFSNCCFKRTAGLRKVRDFCFDSDKTGELTVGWILILYFTCGVGCADTASVALPLIYASQQQYTEAGNVWLTPNANPMQTVASFTCNYVSSQ
jgi:hypothetical protein